MPNAEQNDNIKYLPVIKFRVPQDSGINSDTTSIDLENGFHIRPLQEGIKIKDSRQFLVMGNRVDDEDTAKLNAKKLDIALRLSSLDVRIGIRTKNNNPAERSTFTNIGLAGMHDRENGRYAVNSDDGINIYGVNDAIKGLIFPQMSLFPIEVLHNDEKLINNIKFYFQRNITINEKQDIVIDMLNSAFYEQTHWAKFLLCISAIELLVPPKKKIGISERMVYNISNFVIERKRRTDNESSI